MSTKICPTQVFGMIILMIMIGWAKTKSFYLDKLQAMFEGITYQPFNPPASLLHRPHWPFAKQSCLQKKSCCRKLARHLQHFGREDGKL